MDPADVVEGDHFGGVAPTEYPKPPNGSRQRGGLTLTAPSEGHASPSEAGLGGSGVYERRGPLGARGVYGVATSGSQATPRLVPPPRPAWDAWRVH